MTPSFQIVEAKPYHCGQMARLLRAEQGESVAALGLSAHRELRDRLQRSSFRRAWLIDGRLAALGGVEGTLLASHASLWLALSDEASKYPVALAKEAARQIGEAMRGKELLSTTIMAADAAAKRFARHFGFYACHPLPFEEDAPSYPVERRAGVFQRGALRKGASFGPFIIYTAGRSRTAWLSHFLTYGQARCHNEVAIRFQNMAEVSKFFARHMVGTAETAVAPGWRLIAHFVPGIKTVVVQRDVEDIIDSFARSELAGIATIDEDKLRRIITYEDRCLRQISQQPGVLTVKFSDLGRMQTCRAVFEHCLPYRFDEEWFEALSARNIQSDIADLVRYYQRNLEQVTFFKRESKREMIALVRAGAINRAVEATDA